MSNEFSADFITVNGGVRFKREGAVAPVDIPADGVLVVRSIDGASITLGDGGATELVGIRYVDEFDNDIESFDEFTDAKVIRVATGSTVIVRHAQTVDLDANPLPERRRIVTSSGKDYALESINSQAYFAYVASAGDFRWFFVDRLNYDPDDPNDWSPLPASFPAGLDQLARRAPVVVEGSVALTSGVPVTVWSQEIAETTVVGVRLRWTAGMDTGGGVLLQSGGSVDFTARRDTGGAAAVTNNVAPVESGSFTGGTLSTSASVNDALVQFTASNTGTLVYTYRVEIDPIQF